MSSPTALVLEDDRASREALGRLSENEGFRPILAKTIAEARVALERETPDILLLDLDLPDGSGLEVLEDLKDRPDVDVVLVSGTATIDDAVLAMREGAVDVLTKPVDPKRLRGDLAAARRTAGLRSEVDRLRGELKSLGRFGRLVGRSPACKQLYDHIGKV
ncbi:MAG TPA: response regulator, partial [bacterium]|nr:response regulator [bacterium]